MWNRKKECVKKVLNYIEEHIDKEMNVDKIAKNVGYSKFYLNRVFSECTGITIYKYLQGHRHFHLLLNNYTYTRPKSIEVSGCLYQGKAEFPCVEILITNSLV